MTSRPEPVWDLDVFAPVLQPGELVAWIPTWEGRYAATSLGRILSAARKAVRVIDGESSPHDGKRSVQLQDRATSRKAHQNVAYLVLSAFRPRPEQPGPGQKLVARHLDGNATHDALANLAWGTALQNSEDRARHESIEALAAQGLRPDDIAVSMGHDVGTVGAVLRRRARPEPRSTPWTLADLDAHSGEEFRWVPGWEEEYAVSNQARVFSFQGRKPRELKPVLSRTMRKDRRWGFSFSRDAKLSLHRRSVLVAEAFLGERPGPGHVVRHLDGDALNDQLPNLTWGTQAENVEDMFRTGSATFGERRAGAKLRDEQIPEIRARYERGLVGLEPRISVKALAAEYGVSAGQIHNVVSRKQRNADGRTRQGPGTGRGAGHYRASIDEATARRILAIADAITQQGGHPTPAKVRDQLQALGVTPPPLHTIKGIITGRSWRHLRVDPEPPRA